VTLLLDVNVVLIAHRSDHVQHAVVRPWFDRLLADQQAVTIPSLVRASFVRLVTNRRVVKTPTPVTAAFAFLRSIAEQPSYVALEPGARHSELFERACVEADATGDLVTDAYLAALAIEHGCTLVSLDRDFARFEGLRWERPG